MEVDGPAESSVIDLDRIPMKNEIDPASPPHTHKWDKWQITKEGNITQSYGFEDRVLGTYIDQRRCCIECGKWELDTQVSYAIEDD
jgi:hypothetical protein